jgi:toluene monooxygenase system ferredoxin subunit
MMVEVMEVDELWEGELYATTVAGKPVVVANVAGQIVAFLDRCAHKGVKVSGGVLEGQRLTCPAHHWCYDLSSGRGVNPPSASLVRLPVDVRGGRVLVDMTGWADG